MHMLVENHVEMAHEFHDLKMDSASNLFDNSSKQLYS